MVTRIHKSEVLARADIVDAPQQRACYDRSFELPPVLHIATACLFVGFVSVLSLAFRHPQMVIPWAVFVIFIAAFFAVPGLWTRLKPESSRTHALSWSRFIDEGKDNATGRPGGREATTRVLLVPAQ
jgi:hypothetical protein